MSDVAKDVKQENAAKAAETASIVAEVMKTLLPAIADLRKPYIDPQKEAQREVHRNRERQQEGDRIRNRKQAQDNCPHMHISPNGVRSEALNLTHGQPGGAWALCPHCHAYLKPGHYEIEYNGTANGKHVWIPEDKQYQRVRDLIEAQFKSNNNYA